MKKLFLILAVAAFTLGAANAIAQEPEAAPATEEVAAEAVDNAAAIEAETVVEGETMHHVLMQKFLEGGWEWMLPVLFCLVVGLAIAIERILYLTFSTVNTKKFIANVEEALNKGGIDAAKEVARNHRGPIASIYYQTPSRRLSFPTVRSRPARWRPTCRGSVCSSLCRPCWDLWVPSWV